MASTTNGTFSLKKFYLRLYKNEKKNLETNKQTNENLSKVNEKNGTEDAEEEEEIYKVITSECTTNSPSLTNKAVLEKNEIVRKKKQKKCISDHKDKSMAGLIGWYSVPMIWPVFSLLCIHCMTMMIVMMMMMMNTL